MSLSDDEHQRLDIIARLVRRLQHVKAAGKPTSPVSKVLREAIFFLWESNNCSKFEAAKFRSKKAGVLKRSRNSGVVYDHSVPMACIVDELSKSDGSIGEVRKVLAARLVATVITVEENKLLSSKGLGSKLPEGCSIRNWRQRYRLHDIEIVPNEIYRRR